MLKHLKKLKDRFLNWYILPDKEEDRHPVFDTPVEQVKADAFHPQYILGFSDGHRIARALSDDAIEAIDLRYRKIIKEHIERTYAAYGLPVDPSADYSEESAVIAQLEIMDERLKLMGDLFKQNDRTNLSPSKKMLDSSMNELKGGLITRGMNVDNKPVFCFDCPELRTTEEVWR